MGLFKREKDARDGASPSGAQKSVETVLRDTLVASAAEDNLSGIQQLELMDALRSIYNSRFSHESIQKALRSDPPIRKRVEDFLREVGK